MKPTPVKCDCHGQKTVAMEYSDRYVIKSGDHYLTFMKVEVVRADTHSAGGGDRNSSGNLCVGVAGH
jgi:hypothetical protein